MTSAKVKKSVTSALEQLHEEKERIDTAIDKLETFLSTLADAAAATSTPRRKPKRTHAQPAIEPEFADEPERSRAGWTDEARGAARERMRAYWAERRGKAAHASQARRDKPSVKARDKAQAPTGIPAKASKKAGRQEPTDKGWPPEARQAARERMRRYWAQRRKDKKLG